MALFICQGCGAEQTTWADKCPHCGTSETIRLNQTTDKMVDRVIKGKFKIVKKLGQGGMGAVYLAEQLGIGHKVALKFLKSEFSSDPEIARRFLNEAKSYARVAHPNAVALHDFGQDDDGNLFIAMEYCEGVDLKKVLAEQGKLSMIEGIDIAMQVADVLANAHQKGVIHRDLKPENIMIRRGLRGVHAKVLDFGIARLMDAGTKLTVAGAIAGTPRYMSPEQVEGREVDARADIYSLGICLYEMLTGVQPFDGSTITEILRKQVFEPMPPLTVHSAELDYPALEAVVQRACAKKRDARWPDMVAFGTALSQATPTQAHLRPIPLTGNVGAVRATATPAPVAQSGGNLSGIATPGTLADHTATDGTLVRDVSVPPAASRAATQQASALEVGALNPGAPREPDVAPPAKPPPSRAPMIAAALVGLVVVLGAVFWATRPPTVVEAPPTPKPVEPLPPKPDAPPDDQTEAVKRAAVLAIQQEADRTNLGRARTAWENANLDEVVTYANAVVTDADMLKEAASLKDKVTEVRGKLEKAQALRRGGHCEQALGLFNSVLALNSRVAEARQGVSACHQATIDTTMP